MIRLFKYKWGIRAMKQVTKGSSNHGVTLDKPTVIVTNSKKQLQLGNAGGFSLLSNCINLTSLYIYIRQKHPKHAQGTPHT